MGKAELTEQEWSHFFDVDDLQSGVTKVSIEASEEELHDMSRRLNVKQIHSAKADLKLNKEQGGRTVHVTGSFDAVVTQNCVVTLDDFEQTLSEPVEGWFEDKEKTVSFAAAKREKEAATSYWWVFVKKPQDLQIYPN